MPKRLRSGFAVDYNEAMARKASVEVRRYLAQIGRKGGRSKSISDEERRTNARHAAMVRWRRSREQRLREFPPEETRPKRIWETARELVARIPQSKLRTLPVDGSRRLDHYLYGTPERTR